MTDRDALVDRLARRWVSDPDGRVRLEGLLGVVADVAYAPDPERLARDVSDRLELMDCTTAWVFEDLVRERLSDVRSSRW
jgi:hypothetical protein